MEFDILYFLQELHSPLFDRIMVGISFLGNVGWIWIVLTVLFLCFPRYRRCGIVTALALILDFLICNIGIKNLVARPRPCWLDPSVDLLIPVPKDFSFPSGHSAAAFAVAIVVLLYHRKEGAAILALAVMIAFSRLYLFVHFPTDVLGGCLVGSVCGVIAFMLAGRVEKKIQKNRKCG